jgi:hypothetical protein
MISRLLTIQLATQAVYMIHGHFEALGHSRSINGCLHPGSRMWADSAYPSEIWSVSLFKKFAHCALDADQRTFNYYLSKVHIIHYILQVTKAMTDLYLS